MKPWQERAAQHAHAEAARTPVTAFDPKLPCPDCGGPMKLQLGMWGRFYTCTQAPSCTGRHGAHPNGAPKGIPGNAETRAARAETMKALEAFRDLKGPREVMLVEVSRVSGVSQPFHVARQDAATCRRITAAAKQVFAANRPKNAYTMLRTWLGGD